MNRWSQFAEDPQRLPEGFVRISYDADTQVYTFRDSNGTLYRGTSGAEYGTLTPISSSHSVLGRPGTFESDALRLQKPSGLSVSTNNTSATFHDILPSNSITTASSSELANSPKTPVHASKLANSSARTSPRVRFIEAARKTALPKMQGIVHNLRRSKTTASSSFSRTTSEDTEHLFQRSSTLSRSTSQATTYSGVSESHSSINPRRN